MQVDSSSWFIPKIDKKKDNILIVGSGVLGAYLAKELKNNKNNIIITTRQLKKKYNNFKKLNIQSKVKFVKLDILLNLIVSLSVLNETNYFSVSA